MEKNIKDRMSSLLERLGLTQDEFQDCCGLGAGFVSRITPMIRKKSLDKIKEQFPDVNIDWLVTGRGEMFGEQPEVTTSGVGERLHQFALSLSLSDRQFERATGLSNGYLNKAAQAMTPKIRMMLRSKFPFLNLDWVTTGIGNMMSTGSDEAVNASVKDRLKIFVTSIGIGESRFLSQCGLAAKKVDGLPKVLSDEALSAISEAYPRLNVGWLVSGEGNMLTEMPLSKKDAIPLVRYNQRDIFALRHTDEAFLKSLPGIRTPGGAVAFEISEEDLPCTELAKKDVVAFLEIAKGKLLASPKTGALYAFVAPTGVTLNILQSVDVEKLTVTVQTPNGIIEKSLTEIGKAFEAVWLIRPLS